MVARAGANLRHIAPTHPAARRCGSLKLPHRRSAPRKPAGRQKRRGASPPKRRRTNAARISQGSIERIGGCAPPAPRTARRGRRSGGRRFFGGAGGNCGICHLFVTGTYSRRVFGSAFSIPTIWQSRKCAPRDSNPEPID